MSRFLQKEHVLQRLLSEYAKHGQLIIATDFDDTIFNFHRSGETATSFAPVHAALGECHRRGFPIILHTAAEKERWPDMLAYCERQGFRPAAVNANALPDLPYGHNGKPYANLYLDDRAGLSEALDVLKTVLERTNPISAKDIDALQEGLLIDGLIAEHVLGWTRAAAADNVSWVGYPPGVDVPCEPPASSTDIVKAMEVLEIMHDHCPMVKLFPYPFVRPRLWNAAIGEVIMTSDTPALAICRAALMWIKHDLHGQNSALGRL